MRSVVTVSVLFAVVVLGLMTYGFVAACHQLR